MLSGKVKKGLRSDEPQTRYLQNSKKGDFDYFFPLLKALEIWLKTMFLSISRIYFQNLIRTQNVFTVKLNLISAFI